jgi:hypothetical protein
MAQDRPILSIIIVSYNVRAFLEQCLVSIHKAVQDISNEIFIVDNASTDASPDLVEHKFPAVKVIRNKRNLGFAKANNQAIVKSSGEYICLINPDTIVQEDTLSKLLKFFADNSDAGAIGCKILNPDGSLQLACRRSFPTPWVAFTKIVGLARLFPKSKWFGKYNLTHLDPDRIAKVDAISGSFMLIPKEILDRIGLLDESFFMYGEDLDLCYRIRKDGWSIYYVPTTQIIHFKGESSKKSPFEQRRLFYEAMHLFVQKHFSKGEALLPSWILITAIWMRAVLSFLSQVLQSISMPLLDFICFTFSLAIAIYLRFKPEYPWEAFTSVHMLYSLVWLVSLTAHGVYSRWRLSVTKTTSAVLLGWLVNSALTYFLKIIAFSRAVVLYAGILNLILVPGWRILLKILAIKTRVFKGRFSQSVLGLRSVVVGDEKSVHTVVKRLRSMSEGPYQISGVVLSSKSNLYEINGVPILGKIGDLKDIIVREKIHEIIFATFNLSYKNIFTAINNVNDHSVNFKLIADDMDVMIGKASTDYIKNIPFVDIDYRLSNFYLVLKRIIDLILALFILMVTGPVYIWMRYIKKTSLLRTKYEQNNVSLNYFDHTSRIIRNLPVLFAILKGKISFIGCDIEYWKGGFFLALKPGLTGPEYISQNQPLTTEERERLLLYYVKNYSPLLDFEILLKSIFKFESCD